MAALGYRPEHEPTSQPDQAATLVRVSHAMQAMYLVPLCVSAGSNRDRQPSRSVGA
jgi:hypothetical protein